MLVPDARPGVHAAIAGGSALLGDLTRTQFPLLAPVVLQVEFVSSVWRLERRGNIPREDADKFIGDLCGLPIRYSWDDAWVPRALEIARSTGASRIYDSLYLACAEANGATL